MYQVQAGARMEANVTPSVALGPNSLYARFNWRSPELRLTPYGIFGIPTSSSWGSIVYPNLDGVYASMRRGVRLQTADIEGRSLCPPFAASCLFSRKHNPPGPPQDREWAARNKDDKRARWPKFLNRWRCQSVRFPMDVHRSS